MALSAGTRLGPYEVLASLGAGGMGEVYRARDTKLNRDVALKILPQTFATDPDRLARFHREAQVLASLNHPHIAAIYGFEDSGDTHALVLELVDGPTLADRIALGPLPIDEALAIAAQIAEALEAAHEQGIIHRDLKPANIKVKSDGSVKVLDFGLAKLAEPAGVGQLAAGSALSMSPTITSPAMMTGVGVMLGTAAYMSPEQAKGRPADKRSDIWAFGCVLYEMLTGQRPFGGEDVTETIAGIVKSDPEWAALPATTSPSIRRVVRRCLEKDPRRRLRDVGDARLELEAVDSAETAATTERHRERNGIFIPTWVVWTTPIVVAALMAATGIARAPGGESQRRVERFVIPIPTGYQMYWGETPSLAISPDGATVIYETQGKLRVRSLERFDSEPISGTDGATQPFFSPDGLWIGFVRGNSLMKVPVTGGTPVKIVDAWSPFGATWGRDGRIVFAGALGNGGLWSVSADGGTPEQITSVRESEQETQHMWPEVMPDGSILYTVLGPSGHAADARLVVENRGEGTRTEIAKGVTYGRYVSEHILYADGDGTLLIQPFDPRSRKTTGSARAVVAGVRLSNWGGAVPYAVSSNGTLVYFTGTEFTEHILKELDLAGRERRQFGAPRSFGPYPSLSPDGRTLAISIRSPNNDDIHLMDVATGRFDRFSFGISEDESPVWSPDGLRLAFTSAAVGEQRRIFVKTVASTEPERLLYTGKRHLHLSSWSPDGDWLAVDEFAPRSVDTWLLNVKDTSKIVPIASTPADERGASFSPDGRYVAYSSDETGRYEVYVLSFPTMGGRQQVSHEGGFLPKWSGDSQQLFFFDQYSNSSGHMMSTHRAPSGPGWEEPKPLFDVPRIYDFAVTRDARSIYFIGSNPDGPTREIRVITNWLSEVLSAK